MSDTSELDATDNPVLNAACKRMADCAFDRIESYTVTLTRDECNAVLYCISNLEVDKQALRWDKTALQAEVKRLKAELSYIYSDVDLRESNDQDGTSRLCHELYGKEIVGKYIGGSQAPMLHDAADEIARLREAIEPAKKIAEYVRAYNDGVQQDYYGCVDALKSFEAVLESKPWI